MKQTKQSKANRKCIRFIEPRVRTSSSRVTSATWYWNGMQTNVRSALTDKPHADYG